MKKVYIIMSQTGTILSRLIKLRTGCEFGHVSLSLDKDLDKMYSFGRLNPYNPFIGGFVHERVDSGTFKRFKNTVCEIVEYEVTDEQYKNIERIIRKLEKGFERINFNVLGMALGGLNIKIERTGYLYCAEFVKYLLEDSGIETKLPDIIKPEDFKNLENTTIIYKGLLSQYRESTTQIKPFDKLKLLNNSKEEVV